MGIQQHNARFTIENCKVTSGDYVKRLFSAYMSRHWWWFVLPVLILLGLSIVNIKFIIVALMVLFIIIPMALSLIYFNYALTDEARLSITEKELKVTDEGISIKSLNDSEQEYFLYWKEFYGYEIGGWGIALQHKGWYRFLMIPATAFNDEKQRTACIAFIKRELLR